MGDHDERMNNIITCAEEWGTLQLDCLKQLDLAEIKSKNDIAKSKYNYDVCVKKNMSNYPCLEKRNQILK